MRGESEQVDYDLIDRRITERFRLKKEVNLMISILIAGLGIATLYVAFAVDLGIFSFRYLTINGTLFTTAGSLAFIGANFYELVTLREVDHARVYYLRLSCAVTEAVIMLVVLAAFAAGDAFGLVKWNGVATHVVIPVLTVASFITNDAPIGRVAPLGRLRCTAFITVYAIVILVLFGSGTLPMDLIPYSSVDWRVVPAWQIACFVATVYLVAYAIATMLYQLNKRLSWLWFRDLVPRGTGGRP